MSLVSIIAEGFSNARRNATYRTAGGESGKMQHLSNGLRNGGGMPLAAASSCVADYFGAYCRTENVCDTVRCVVESLWCDDKTLSCQPCCATIPN